MNENRKEALQLSEAVLAHAIDQATTRSGRRVMLEAHEARGIVDLLRKLLKEQSQ